MGDPMLEIEKCCKEVFTPPTREKFENKFRSFDILSIEAQSVEVIATLNEFLL